jgi:phosphoribosyl 1,2-cyclic phosphate phosphodiesterase
VFAVTSNHPGNGPEEYSLNYVVEKNGKRLLYAADTGLYSVENLRALQDFQCDTVVMEGTYGSLTMDRGISHLTCDSFIENAEKMVTWGVARPDARFFVTHINQCHSFTHEEYEAYMRAHSALNITVAYDGFRVFE